MFYLNSNLSNRITVFFFTLLMALYSLPIVLTDRPYIDDLGRTLYGYTGWGANGRPLSDIVMQVMSFGGLLLDLSPLNQMLGIVLICLTLYFYCLKNFKNINTAGIFITIFLFLANPYYIENISYKYDSLPMALSMVMLILPFIIKNEHYASKILSIAFVFASLSFYQASIGLFAILTVIEIIANNIENGNKKVFLSIANRTMQLIIGFILYKILIAPNFVEGEYNLVHSQTIPLSQDSIHIVKDNIIQVYWFLNAYLVTVPLFLKIIVSCAISYSLISDCTALCKSSVKNNLLSILITLSSPVLVVFLALAPLVMLKNPVFAPRVLLALSGVIILYTYLILKNLKSPYIQSIIFIPVIWLSMVYSYAYSTSSKSQASLDTLISSSIFQEVTHYGRDFKYVNVNGVMPNASQLKISISKFPLMSKLIPIYLNYDWLWGAELLNHYGMNLQYKVLTKEQQDFICKGDKISKGGLYSLYAYNDILLIDFKNTKC
ncbi:glucosyltransferase domain-containing protein [Pantoea sp. ACRSB]|uniref:glucosyltransferase domain-containing protein n=1 Tax=Pantoea sp. ACRSB TaxID=2918207 RepID=UPI002892FACB|nr:glucosyltransferase domain-containing protein [Pantoea sp. ACRSB]MCG7388270.1 glucosyltransferase domain-containing protein [Pantoea sp. ACRSB]